MTADATRGAMMQSGGGPRAFPPGPRPRYPGEMLVTLLRDRLTFFERIARHGDITHVRLGGRHIYVLRHPDLIKDVLVTHSRHFVRGRGLRRAKRLLGEGLLTSEGELHRRQRRLIQPAFHRQRIAGYARTMAAYAARERDRWRDGETLDLHAAMMRLTLAIAGKALFDADIEGEATEIGDAVTQAIDTFEIAVLPFSELLDHLPLPWVRRFDAARARLDDTVYRMIAERRQGGGDRGDLLSMLLAARDEEGDGAGMTDEQLRDEVLTLLLAGHETTANALVWTWCLLARHPEVERTLHEEVDGMLGGAAPTMDDVARLPYTRMVLAESMRLYPPAWLLGHEAAAEVEIGGWHIPAGSLCIMPQLIVHRDERWWPEPERFVPERFAPDAQQSRPRFAYFPFGGGPRQCIGEQFAWTEGIIVLATIAQRWRLALASGAPVKPRPAFTLRPEGRVMVRVEGRQ
ncbi:MAG TPA: cytochrome P450 [Gemmatimonadaceae bacterium]|nr:cytochrome P450 [Gemmatimonadaceae bacterium]